jgi:hypothetical protein
MNGRRPVLRYAVIISLVTACGGDPTGPSSGRLAVSISGLPAGTPADIHITGPAGYGRDLGASTTLSGRAPGGYVVAAEVVLAGGETYAPSPATQSISVSDADAPSAASVVYAAARGSLTITATGLPVGTDPAITITGPAGYNQSVTSTGTLSGLVPGEYTLTAAAVSDGSDQYNPSPQSQTVVVQADVATAAEVAYSTGSSAGFNLRVDGLYMVQSVQTYNRSVPLVGNRDALLRIFVTANQVNLAAPSVRVHLYNNGIPISTSLITSPAASTPQSVDQRNLTSSWNLVIPKAMVQPNLAVLVEVDPENAVAEGDEGDNSFPANGVPLPVDVRSTSAFAVRFVPVVTTGDGRTGNVSTANMAQFLTAAMGMHPLAAYDAVVGQPYNTTTNTPLGSDGTGWGTILGEIEALRADAGDGRSWYGVVNPNYSSGVAGMGYVGAPSAIGWDKPSSAAGVAAHEWGHTWGRKHAPCGGASDPDGSYPYAGGVTGVYGLDQAANTVKLPTGHDLMGYCSNEWISDYTYVNVLNYRAQQPTVAGVSQAVQPALLVWGRVERDRLVLEPAFRVTTRPSLPEAPGPYRIEGRAADGSILFRADFAPAEVADVPDAPRSFAFAIPLSAARADRLASLALVGEGRTATVSASPQPAAVDVSPGPAGRVRIRWDASRAPVVLVRDPATGQVISFARGGQADLVTSRRELALSVADRVGGREFRVVVPSR